MPGRVNKLCFKHIYSTFQSISVQTHQSWMLIDFNVAKIWKHPDRPPLTAFAWSTVSWLQVKTHLERTGQFCVWVQRLPWPPKRKDPNKCQASVFQALMIKPQAQLSMDVWSTLQTNNRHWRWCYERSGGSADDDVMEDQVGQLTMMLWKIRWVSWRWCYGRSGGSADDDVMEDQVGQLTMMLWKIRWVSWRWCYGRSGGSADDDVMEDQVGQLTAFSSADGGYCGISFELISSQSHHYVSVTTDELHR